MAMLSHANFSGASGAAYRFAVYSRETDFNNVAGVYVFSRRFRNQREGFLHDVLYVGETEELSDRLAQHHKLNLAVQAGCNCICFLPEPDRRRRLSVEADLRRGNKPPYNDQ